VQEQILEGVHAIQVEKTRLYEQIRQLDEQIDEKVRTSVPHVIANYEKLKIRRAEFIGDVPLANDNKKDGRGQKASG